MILTPQARKSLETGLAKLKGLEEKLQYLEQLGEASPQYKERAAQLRERHKYLMTLATVGITADSSSR